MPNSPDTAPKSDTQPKLQTRFFATAPRGTEAVLAAELEELGISPVVEERGGVAFGAELEDAYRACLWSRVASRVLLPLASFEARNADALYAGAHAISWLEHLGPDRTIAVDVAGRDAPAGPPHFVALKTKDAIVDRIREAEGRRPDVDTDDPDVRLNVHLWGAQVTVSLDLAGQSLHRRGIDRRGARAPLKENLAAALLRLAGWSRDTSDRPVLDPFCGSGTILAEAAGIALDVAPGLARGGFGAEGWRGHDAKLWEALRDEARERQKAAFGRSLELAGSDVSRAAIDSARRHLERAGYSRYVRLAMRDLRDVEPPFDTAGLVVTNPPYGARLGEAPELSPLYRLLGDVLKRRFPGWTAFILCGEPMLAKRIGLRPAARHILWNGPIECRLLEVPISEKPVESEDGPGWRKPDNEAKAFAKKLLKNRKGLSRWTRRQGLTAYRLYDADMPQFNLSVDWYDGAVRVEEYERPRKVPEEEAEKRLRDVLAVIPETLDVEPEDVHLRVRKRRSKEEPSGKRADRRQFREVNEGDMRFLVNLTDYLDTGLFLDDRVLRDGFRHRCEGRHFLNLFAYTCTASVAAAKGGARSTTNIDLSKTYLEWGERNFELNGLDPTAHRFLRADVLAWLERETRLFDLIFVAPPTVSRSKAMREDFDIQRDHVSLLERCARRLSPRGEMIFTTNLRDFELDERALRHLVTREITTKVTPPDFQRRPRFRAWTVTLRDVSRRDDSGGRGRSKPGRSQPGRPQPGRPKPGRQKSGKRTRPSSRKRPSR